MANMDVDVTTNSINDAYHGTLLDDANKIIAEKKFIPSKQKDSYLGDGVYFYEGSRWLAANWVERNHGKNSIIGIICACVHFGRCLNLNIPEHRKILKKVKNKISQHPKVKYSGKKITDAFVVNYYATNVNRNIDTVRLTYICKDYENLYDGKLYEGSNIYDFAQPMLCVRNQDRITNIVLSFQGGNYYE